MNKQQFEEQVRALVQDIGGSITGGVGPYKTEDEAVSAVAALAQQYADGQRVQELKALKFHVRHDCETCEINHHYLMARIDVLAALTTKREPTE